jgi:hypothetical protein
MPMTAIEAFEQLLLRQMRASGKLHGIVQAHNGLWVCGSGSVPFEQLELTKEIRAKQGRSG